MGLAKGAMKSQWNPPEIDLRCREIYCILQIVQVLCIALCNDPLLNYLLGIAPSKLVKATDIDFSFYEV